MKNKIFYLIILLGGVFATSCEDFLDTESLSTDDLEYLCSNPTDARKMISHVYSYYCRDTYTSRMSNNWNQNTDVEFATVSRDQALAHNDRRGIWALNAGDFGDIKNCWEESYEAIDFANQIIVGIEASELFQQGDKDMKQIYGEAHCTRAYSYWLLCNFWADVPFATLPSAYDTENNTPRVDKNVIYSHLIQDLINVEEDMLWADQLNNGVEWMNREFALGFIVKLSMFRAGYSMQADGTMDRCRIDGEIEPVNYIDENGNAAIASTSDDFYKVARAYAKKLIALKDRELPNDFKNIFYTQINSASAPNGDVLFEMGYVQGGGGDVGWNIGLSVVGGSKGAGTTYTNMHPYYACSFDQEDQRFEVTCASYRWLTDNKQNAMGPFGISPAKWCRLDMDTYVESKGTGINWPVLRYPDVLLLLAEAINETEGPTSEARNLLKRVRDRAYAYSDQRAEKVDNYINSLSNYAEFKQALIQERAWEFGGECIRKFDLIRWNYYSDAIVNTLEWMIEAGINVRQLERVGSELIENKNKPIQDLGVANALYFVIENGLVRFENDIFTARDETVNLYANADKLADDAFNAGDTKGDINEELYYIDFSKSFISVSNTDPNNNSYGKDEDGNDIKKGTVSDNILYAYYGLTEGTMITGTEDLTPLRSKVTPYVMPISSSKTTTSNGVLSNDGYGIRNK